MAVAAMFLPFFLIFLQPKCPVILKDQIELWLKTEGGFKMGLELYKKAGLSQYLSEFEQAAYQDFIAPDTYDRLRGSLIIVSGNLKSKYKKKQYDSDTDNEPTAILSLRQRGKHLKGLESDIHGQMKAYANTENPTKFKVKLYQLAKQLMTKIEPELDEVYGAIREWQINGSIPVAGKERIVADTVAKLRKYENLRKRISKINGWIKGGELESTEQEKYESEMAAKKSEMVTIKEELNL